MEHSPQRKSSQNAVLYLGQEHKLHDSDKGDSEVELDFEFDERDIRYSPLLIQQVAWRRFIFLFLAHIYLGVYLLVSTRFIWNISLRHTKINV